MFSEVKGPRYKWAYVSCFLQTVYFYTIAVDGEDDITDQGQQSRPSSDWQEVAVGASHVVVVERQSFRDFPFKVRTEEGDLVLEAGGGGVAAVTAASRWRGTKG